MKTKYLVPLTACFIAFGLTSCTDLEEGAAVGAVIGGVIVDQSGHSHYHRDRCDHCYRHYRLADTNVTSEADSVAQKYNIPVETAQFIVTGLRQAQNKNYSALSNIGLTPNDAIAFYKNKGLSNAAIVNMSESIGFSVAETKDLMQDMSADIQAEKARQNLN